MGKIHNQRLDKQMISIMIKYSALILFSIILNIVICSCGGKSYNIDNQDKLSNETLGYKKYNEILDSLTNSKYYSPNHIYSDNICLKFINDKYIKIVDTLKNLTSNLRAYPKNSNKKRINYFTNDSYYNYKIAQFRIGAGLHLTIDNNRKLFAYKAVFTIDNYDTTQETLNSISKVFIFKYFPCLKNLRHPFIFKKDEYRVIHHMDFNEYFYIDTFTYFRNKKTKTYVMSYWVQLKNLN
jgi:hypothetical protein